MQIINKKIDLFIDGSLKTLKLSKPQGIKLIMGKLKTDYFNNVFTVHQYLFNDSQWTFEDAQKWIIEHKGMTEALLGKNEIINLGEEEKRSIEMKIDKRKVYANDRLTDLKDFNNEEMSFTAIASSSGIDRDGDVLEASGWGLKDYKNNPIVLWGHDSSLMPIAKAKNVWVDGDTLKFTPIFAPADVNPFATSVYQAYRQGFLTSFSVRFDPKKWEDMPHEDNTMRYGRRYKAMDLLEISCVNVPANPEAHKSRDMAEFIHKSYLFEHYGKDCKDFDFNIASIYEKADAELKTKIEKLNDLYNKKNEIFSDQNRIETEKQIDSKIKELELELELINKEGLLKKSIKELQVGITRLLNK